MTVRTDDAAAELMRHLDMLQPFQHNLFILFNKIDIPLANSVELNAETKDAYINMIERVHDVAGYIFYHKDIDPEFLLSALVYACSTCERFSYSFSDFEFAWNFDIESDLGKVDWSALSLHCVAMWRASCEALRTTS